MVTIGDLDAGEDADIEKLLHVFADSDCDVW